MYFVYILTNKLNTVLYIGVTNNIIKRIEQHKNKIVEGFTKKYHLMKLIYFEQYENINDAILREKRFKKWNRSWKNELISKKNPKWNDLTTLLKY